MALSSEQCRSCTPGVCSGCLALHSALPESGWGRGAGGEAAVDRFTALICSTCPAPLGRGIEMLLSACCSLWWTRQVRTEGEGGWEWLWGFPIQDWRAEQRPSLLSSDQSKKASGRVHLGEVFLVPLARLLGRALVLVSARAGPVLGRKGRGCSGTCVLLLVPPWSLLPWSAHSRCVQGVPWWSGRSAFTTDVGSTAAACPISSPMPGGRLGTSRVQEYLGNQVSPLFQHLQDPKQLINFRREHY